MIIEWTEGFEINVAACNNKVVISANKEGLLSLAKQLTALAEGEPGTHIHYDEYSSLEEGSAEMIIEKAAQTTVPCSGSQEQRSNPKNAYTQS